jgi:hypothetical protein
MSKFVLVALSSGNPASPVCGKLQGISVSSSGALCDNAFQSTGKPLLLWLESPTLPTSFSTVHSEPQNSVLAAASLRDAAPNTE